ncbi:MAG: hypothetical protein K6T55_02950 [Syntrophobacterales bacterium]|nr:hypothetical protein [Syntrophobacterales bacterium]
MAVRPAARVLLWGVLLGMAFWRPAVGAATAPPPALRPHLVDPTAAPAVARLLPQLHLRYDPGLTPGERDREFLAQLRYSKDRLEVGRLVDLRHQSLHLLNAHGSREPSWEYLRRRSWPQGGRVGVTLSVPVWVPSQARRVPTYAGFEKRWETVAQTLPRPSGFVWFAPEMRDINDKARYRAERIHFEVNSRFAPLAALLLEYIFREGWYEPDRRVPLLVVRGGEDTYAAPAYGGPVTAQVLSFPDEEGTSLAARVVTVSLPHLAALYHGRHAQASNHRLGLALDLNDFNYPGVMDGPPNPISRALRQFDRDAMHRLDARHLPAWVYRAAKWVGLRLPQEWTYVGYHTDWAHLDVGTK